MARQKFTQQDQDNEEYTLTGQPQQQPDSTDNELYALTGQQDNPNQQYNSDNEYDPMKNKKDQGTPHMAGGGLLEDFGVDTGDTGTQKVGLTAPPGPPPSLTLPSADNNYSLLMNQQTPAPVASPAPAVQPKPVIQAQQAPVASKPLPGMPPDVTGDDLRSLLSQNKASLEKYGPEQQMAVQDALIKQRSGLMPTLARAGGGLADSIMQGVARAGSSNFQKNITDEQNQFATEKMNTMDKAQAGKMAQMKEQMALSQNDPNSPLSKVAQNAERTNLKNLGWTDDQISKTSANMIGEATKNGLSFYEAQQTEGLKEATLAQTGAYQRGMLQNAQSGRQQEAAKTLNSRGMLRRATDAVTGNPSTKILEQQAAGNSGSFSPDVTAYAQAHGITPEQAQIQKDRRTKGQ